MSGVLHERVVDPVRGAVAGLRAAATAAADRGYPGLAAQLEDLAEVLRALPRSDAEGVARAFSASRTNLPNQLWESVP
jgi:hypothetical protein